MTKRRRAFANSRDAVACVVLFCLVLLVGARSAAHLRHVSRQDRCSANLAVIGLSAKFYANDNGERWMIPPFRRQSIDNGGIDYLAGTQVNDPPVEPGEVGYEREIETTSEHPSDPLSGSTAVAATRAFWLLLRNEPLDTETFVCPVTRDFRDPALVPEWYYDFAGYENVSYGYYVPFGPREIQPRDSHDPRVVFAADKGPYYLRTTAPLFEAPNGGELTLERPPAHWRRFNSPNHHGLGQNALYVDAHVAFDRTPAMGIHGDNIYTLMVDEWDETGFNRLHGESPHFATVAEFPYPGQGALGRDEGFFASTDSLIYP